jgi:hypothetical protein
VSVTNVAVAAAATDARIVRSSATSITSAQFAARPSKGGMKLVRRPSLWGTLG